MGQRKPHSACREVVSWNVQHQLMPKNEAFLLELLYPKQSRHSLPLWWQLWETCNVVLCSEQRDVGGTQSNCREPLCGKVEGQSRPGEQKRKREVLAPYVQGPAPVTGAQSENGLRNSHPYLLHGSPLTLLFKIKYRWVVPPSCKGRGWWSHMGTIYSDFYKSSLLIPLLILMS